MLESIDNITTEKFGELEDAFYDYHDPLEELQVNYLFENKNQILV
jgi:hypothetical protein